MTVTLEFFVKDFPVPDGLAHTPEVEQFLVRENTQNRSILVGWDLQGSDTYRFRFCREQDEALRGKMGIDGLMVSPWQVYSFAGLENTKGFSMPAGHTFRILRLATDYEYMVPGDPVEYLRLADMHKLGMAEVVSTKRTLIRFLTNDDVADFRRLVGGDDQDGLDARELISRYYEKEFSLDTHVVVVTLRSTTLISTDNEPKELVVNTGGLRAVVHPITKPRPHNP